MTGYARRRLLLGLLLATLVALVLDLTGSALTRQARSVAAAALGPVQRAAVGVDHGETSRLAEENALLRAQLAQADARLAADAAQGRLLSSPSASAGRLLPARVVGANTTAAGGRQVTIDVGDRDGVAPNLTVVSADGLVGRVVTVGPWSSDVRVLGGADASVAVRVGAGALGSVAATSTSDLTLTLVDRSSVAPGDRVTTLGSIGGRPYVPGVLVGTVTSVDSSAGHLTTTATVRPAVDDARLDVVAVVLTAPASGSAS